MTKIGDLLIFLLFIGAYLPLLRERWHYCTNDAS